MIICRGLAVLLLWAPFLAEDVTSSDASCSAVLLPGEQMYGARAFLEPVTSWLQGSLDEKGELLLDDLNGDLNFGCDPSHCHSALCSAERVSLGIMSCLRSGSGCDKIFWGSIRVPWENLLRTPWPLFELVALWSQRQRDAAATKTPSMERRCTTMSLSQLRKFDEKFVGDQISHLNSAPSIRQAGARFLVAVLMEHAKLEQWMQLVDLCGRLLWSTLIVSLSLARDDTAISTGYAVRSLGVDFTHAYMDQHGEGEEAGALQLLATGPWNVLQFLPVLAARERARDLGFQTIGFEENAPKSLTSDSPAPFTPMDAEASRRLEDSLEVAHDLLQILGFAYMLIAGSLLGAARHLGRIPWDDDVDLCVDAVHERKFVGLAMAVEAAALGLRLPSEMSLRMRRAVALLQSTSHTLEIVSSRSLVFRVKRLDAKEHDAAVDIWMCFHMSTRLEESEDVVLMSQMFGPRVPRRLVEPLQKLPFGRLVLWGPADPEEVTRWYLNFSEPAADFMTTCRGRKLHSQKVEFEDEIPCYQLGDSLSFASRWQAIDIESQEAQQVREAYRHVLQQQLPGLTPQATSKVLEVHRATLEPEPTRYRVRWQGNNEEWGPVVCTALLWHGDQKADLLLPGFQSRGPPVRSLTCGEAGETPHFVWEDART